MLIERLGSGAIRGGSVHDAPDGAVAAEHEVVLVTAIVERSTPIARDVDVEVLGGG